MMKAKPSPKIICLLLHLLFIMVGVAEALAEPTKVGVPTALTGDAAAFGVDIKNALSLMNEKFGGGAYDLIFEDDKCDNRTAVSVARKFIDIDKARYVLGFACNSTMLATAPIYDRAGAFVLTSSATSGDVLDVGKNNFRLFPSDVGAATLIFDYMSARHTKIAVLTEQNEYPVMMERTMRARNGEHKAPVDLLSEEFVHGETDLRTVIAKLIAKGVEAIMVNASTDNSFIPVVKQLRSLQFKGALYAAYLPGSAVVLKELGEKVDGIAYSNLPTADELLTEKGRALLAEFRRRYGEPQSGFPVVPISFEAFRIFDLAMKSGKPPSEFLRLTSFEDGYIPNYHFDQHGAVQGIQFQMQRIEHGKVVVVKE